MQVSIVTHFLFRFFCFYFLYSCPKLELSTMSIEQERGHYNGMAPSGSEHVQAAFIAATVL